MVGSPAVAYSPCPNDTFVFHAWAAGLLPSAPRPRVTIADIDITNALARQGSMDVLKVSYAALPYLLDRYALLPCGGALGHGCGPLLLTRRRGDQSVIGGGTVAIPSELSTACLLLRLWAAETLGHAVRTVTLPFHEIMPAVRDGAVLAGLVIHEARFTFPQFGLHCLVDLGEWWNASTGLPIPLGAIVARRDLGPERIAAIADAIRASVRHAWANPQDSRGYVRKHAQEMAPEVVDQHISLYVNEFTEDLGETGHAAVRTLLSRATAEVASPSFPIEALEVAGARQVASCG